MKKQPPSHKSIAAATGASRRSVTKWLEEAGLKPTDAGATELCQLKHKKKDKELIQQEFVDEGKIDPVSGLSWSVLEIKEKALKLARENRRDERLEGETYMEVAAHHLIMTTIAESLNQFAQRAKSEMGLSESQTKRMERLLDEVRSKGSVEIKSLNEDTSEDSQ